MKTLISLIILTFLVPAYTCAQDRYGVLLGGGSSNIDNYRHYFNIKTNDRQQDIVIYPFERLFSWKAGVYYLKSLKWKGLEIGTEFLVSGMGAYVPYDTWEVTPGVTLVRQAYNERLIYLSIPLYIRFSNNSFWYLSTGITNSLLVYKPPIYNFSDARKYDLGGTLAFGVTLFPKIVLEINVYHSLIRINPEAFDGDLDNRLFNRSLAVSLKYELGQRK